MRHTPSDHQCLRAAQRALVAHLETRPATTAEALEIAARHRAEHADLIARAEGMEHRYSHHEIPQGRGPWMPDERHNASIAATQDLQEAGRIRQRALRPLLRAEAWERIAAAPAAAWEATRLELQGRADHYHGLITARVT